MTQAVAVDLRGKHVIVTGASQQSLGFATAQILARWGAHVAITTRKQSSVAAARLRELSGGQVDGYDMDLTDTQSVEAFVNAYQQAHGQRLDVLINNAGIHLDLRSTWQTPRCTEDGFEIHWRTNYLGTAQLTHLLLPLLLQTAQQQGEARVVNVVSMLHSKGSNVALFAPLEPYNSWRAYGTSKLALMHHATEIERRYGTQGLHAYSLHPGAVYTRIADKGLAEHPLLIQLRQIFASVEAFFLLTPDQGAQTSVYCATAPDLRGGAYFVKCGEARPSGEAQDAAAAGRLWDGTQEWLATGNGGQ